MTDYIFTITSDSFSAINLSVAKKIYCKVDKRKLKEKEGEEELICLYADDKLVAAFSRDILDKTIKEHILNKNLVSNYFEIDYIDKVIKLEDLKQIEKYGCKTIDNTIDSLIEDENLSNDIFEDYKVYFAYRFLIVFKRSQEKQPPVVAEVFRKIVLGDLVRRALNKLKED